MSNTWPFTPCSVPLAIYSILSWLSILSISEVAYNKIKKNIYIYIRVLITKLILDQILILKLKVKQKKEKLSTAIKIKSLKSLIAFECCRIIISKLESDESCQQFTPLILAIFFLIRKQVVFLRKNNRLIFHEKHVAEFPYRSTGNARPPRP